MLRVKKFIKENWKFFIFLFGFYFILNYELPFAIYTPGGAINMGERISGENTYDAQGSINMTYVSMVRGSLPFLALSYIIPNWDIVSTKDIAYDNDLDKTVEIDKIYMKEAISNAEAVAYRYANIEYEEISSKSIITYVADYADTKMDYGDELKTIDGFPCNSLKELQTYLSIKKPGDIVEVVYAHKGNDVEERITLKDIDGLPKIGISMASISEYLTPYNIEVKTEANESGPSGGLMTALEIYNKITEVDLTHGLTIMGTGTIEKDGTVGEIGGVKYKLIGAVKRHADVFVCPKENYEDAMKVKSENGYDIDIIYAENFEDALSKLSYLE